jgi:glycosyltransferase involved in cell wall biosynthesis
MRIALVCENVSLRMGGEAQKSIYFLEQLLRMGIDVRVVTHERVRREIEALYADRPEVLERFHFVEDALLQKLIWKGRKLLPTRISEALVGNVNHFITMWSARGHIRRLAGAGVDAVWQPIPISPKGLCLLTGLGVPVVCGPMCGGLDFPPGFRFMDPPLARVVFRMMRGLSDALHLVFPGKRRAAALIVSNERSARALPAGVSGELVVGVPESGVDLDEWGSRPRAPVGDGVVRFLFVGRLVDWKGVQYLLPAFARAQGEAAMELHVVGDGPLRRMLEASAASLGLQEKVTFHGWKDKASTQALMSRADVFVMPSLRECGGNAILEAMALGLPLIVCNWAGPAQYASAECAVLVDPDDPAGFVAGLGAAIADLARDPARRERMGRAASDRVRSGYFSWEAKTRKVVDVLRSVSARARSRVP